MVILATYTIVEGATVYPDGLTGLQARRVINREDPEEVLGVSGRGLLITLHVCYFNEIKCFLLSLSFS